MARLASEIIYKLVADEKDLVKSLKAAEKKTDDLAKSFKDTGKALTIGLTVPLVAVGAGMLKLAADAGNAADRLLDLEQITGLSTDTLQEFKNVAVVAGVDFESLVGSLTKFTSRLASIESEGGPAAEAVERLGVNIRDTSGELRSADELFPEFLDKLNQVENVTERNALAQQIFGRSLESLAPVLDLTAEQLQNARDQARELGFVQSKEALIAANNYRIELDRLKLSIQSQAQILGQNLIPIVQDLIPIIADVVGTIAGWAKSFTDLDKNTQRIILVAAGFAAALGPVLIGVGQAITAFGTLKIATIALNAALLANPLIAAGAAVAAGIALVAGAFIIAADNSKKAASEAEKLNTILSGGTTGNLKDDLDIINKKLEETRKAWTAAQDPRVPEASRAIIREQLADYQKISESLTKQFLAAEKIQPTQQRITAAAQQEAKAKEDAEAAAARLLAVENKYKEARERVLSILAEEKTEYQLIQEQIDELQKTPWAQGKLEEDRLAAIKKLRTQQEAILIEELRSTEEKAKQARDAKIAAEDEAFARKKAIVDQIRGIENAAERKLFEQSATRLQLLEREKNEAIDAAKERGADTAKILLFYEKEIEKEKKDIAKKEEQRNLDAFRNQLDRAKQLFDFLKDISNQYTAILLANIDAELQAALEANNLQEKSKIQSLRDQLAEAKIKLFEEVDEEKKAEIQKTIDKLNEEIRRQEIVDEYEAKKAQILREQAKFNKVISLFNIAVNTAVEASKVLSNPFLAAAVIAAGVAQAAIVAATPLPPVPKFAEGGQFIVPPGFNNDSFPMLVQSGERVTVETPAQQRAGGSKNVFQIGTVIADPAGLRELNRVLRKYGTVEDIREGV